MDNASFFGLLYNAIQLIRKYGWYSDKEDRDIYNPAKGFELLVEDGDNLIESFCYTADEFKDEIVLHFTKEFNHAQIKITADDTNMSEVVMAVIDSVRKSESYRTAKRAADSKEMLRRSNMRVAEYYSNNKE